MIKYMSTALHVKNNKTKYTTALYIPYFQVLYTNIPVFDNLIIDKDESMINPTTPCGKIAIIGNDLFTV